MLVVTRRKGEGIKIGQSTFLEVLEVKGDRIRLGIDAPPEIAILRTEIAEKTREHNRKAVNLDLDSLRHHLRPRPSAFQERREKLEPVRRFSRLFVHEINNYMTALRGEAELALYEPVEAPVKESLEAILGTCRELNGMLNQITACGGRGCNDQPVALEDFWDTLSEQVRSVRASVRLQRSDSSCGEDLTIAEGVLGVILPLVENAADWSAPEKEISVTLVVHPESFLITVQDSGLGMDSHTASRCWEPLYSTRTGRHGLGLSLACGILGELQGELALESKLGVGTTARVTIPRQARKRPRARQQVILDESTWASHAQTLEFQDMQVFKAESQAELSQLAAIYPRAALLTSNPQPEELLDRQMRPGANCEQTLEQLRCWSPPRTTAV